jgi:hypothetical protein
MNIDTVKRSLRTTSILMVIALANAIRLTGSNNLRAVNVVALLGCGMVIGVFLVNLIMFFKLKKQQNS